MAAAVSSPWSKKPGAWALDSEQHEEELKNETLTVANKGAGDGDAADFPSLTAAVTTKAKKKKPLTMSLSEFSTSKTAPKTQSLTTEDLISLPTGPRQRSAEELADRSRLGGGFRSYGSDRGFDEPRKREGFGSREPIGSSRADEADDWGSMKRPVERRERGFFGSSDSKADESDNWARNKSFVPSEGRKFDSSRERRVGFASSGAADAENWVRKKEEEGGKRFGGSAFDSLKERRGGFGNGDSDDWGKKKEEAGAGSARPKLNLQPRTVPVGERNGSGVLVAKPKGSNPFGEARHREEVLKEKGQDCKEIDEKLESMKVKEVEVAPPGKRGFGSSDWRGPSPDVRVERSWRKPDSADVRPQSADKVENGIAEEVLDLQE